MAKTFEALQKAEKEHQIRPEEAKIFDIRPQARPLPLNFKLPPQVVEEYQRMKHLIRNAHPAKKIKTILFVSAKEGEGTTTTLRNFAITLAAGGETVVLVDANLRNPTVHDLFNLDKKGGFTELVRGENSLAETVKKTEIEHLYVVTNGIPHSNPSSLLESKLLDSLIAQMTERADWVLFDSAPINSYNDSSTLATKVDGVMMVIEAETTRWEVAKSARERIESEKVKLLGVVLNRRKMYIPEWAYRRL